VVARVAGGAAVVTTAMFLFSVVWPFNHRAGEHYEDGLVGVLGENAYAIAVLALMFLLPIRAPEVAATAPSPPLAQAVAAE
jgi:hypothetical protein